MQAIILKLFNLINRILFLYQHLILIFKIRNIKKTGIVLIIFLISISGLSQNTKQKVIFIYSFTKYISLPTGSIQGDFIIKSFKLRFTMLLSNVLFFAEKRNEPNTLLS